MSTLKKFFRNSESSEDSSEYQDRRLFTRREFVRNTAMFAVGAAVGIDLWTGQNDQVEASPLLINNSLFWQYKGQPLATWLDLCGDAGTKDRRDKHIQWCQKYGCNSVVLCLNNAEYMSLFRNGYMRDWDTNKVNMFTGYVSQLKSLRGRIVIAFFDGPENGGKYAPILSCWDRHQAFIQIACQALNPYVYAYLIGCETNRYFSTGQVETLIRWTKQYAGSIPVGTHEQWNPKARRWPGNADFICYEHSWHPKDGDSKSASDCVKEINNIKNKLPPNYSVWAGEWNMNSWGSKSRVQARAMAALPSVYGIGGPL